jgi:hypothetical protein
VEIGVQNPGITKSEIALILFLCIVFAVLIFISLLKGAELNKGTIVLPQEEHFQIGYEYYKTGKLFYYGVPSVFRSPGYPAYVAIGLHLRDLIAPFFNRVGVNSFNAAQEGSKWVLSISWVLEDKIGC